MQYTLGRDELAFHDWWNPMGIVDPTAIERAATILSSEAQSRGGINIDFRDFLTRYVGISKLWSTDLDATGRDQYINKMVSDYGMSATTLDKAFSLFVEMRKSGRIADIVWNPTGYTPESAGEAGNPLTDIGAGVKKVSTTVNTILVVAALFAVGYVVTSATKAKREFFA